MTTNERKALIIEFLAQLEEERNSLWSSEDFIRDQIVLLIKEKEIDAGENWEVSIFANEGTEIVGAVESPDKVELFKIDLAGDSDA